MRILQVLETSELGGVERIVFMLHRYLLAQGEESAVCISSGMREQFVSHFMLSGREAEKVLPFRTDSPLKGVGSLLSLDRQIRRFQPDLVHSHARRECMYVSVSNRFSRDFLHVRTQHSHIPNRRKELPFEGKMVSGSINAWVASYQRLADEHVRELSYVDMRKVLAIYNGVPEPQAVKSPAYQPGNRYCAVSRLSVEKGFDTLLQALRALPQALLDQISVDIYGDGPEREALLALRQSLGLEGTVRFMGPTKTPTEVMCRYDALLMPSRYEGLPMAMLEALSTGTPVAAHDVGCVREIIEPGKNGWIIDENYRWEDFFRENSEGAADYAALSAAARETYLAKYTDEEMSRQYYELYKSLLESGGTKLPGERTGRRA